MLTNRRPVKRSIPRKRSAKSINYPQLRKEVLLYSNLGLIIKDSDFFKNAGKETLNIS